MKVWTFPLDIPHLGKIATSLAVLSLAYTGAIQAMPADAPAPPVHAPALAVAVPPAKPTAKPTSAAKTNGNKSDWNKLSPAQKTALAPLAGDWNKLDSFRREKWLELANRFTTMSPSDQERMQERMREWVKLTPDQRRLARENYNRAKKLNAEQRTKQWEEYQQLPDEKKKQLAETSPPKKRIVNPPRPPIGKNSVQTKVTPKPVPSKQPLPRAEAIQPSLPIIQAPIQAPAPTPSPAP